MEVNDNFIIKMLKEASKRGEEDNKKKSEYDKRILEMMNEYDISLSEAIEWDMDGFPDAPNNYGEDNDIPYEIDFYLWTNGVTYSQSLYYRDVLLGKEPNKKLL